MYTYPTCISLQSCLNVRYKYNSLRPVYTHIYCTERLTLQVMATLKTQDLSEQKVDWKHLDVLPLYSTREITFCNFMFAIESKFFPGRVDLCSEE